MNATMPHPTTPTLGQDNYDNTIYDITRIDPMDCPLCEALIYPVTSNRGKRMFVGGDGTRHNCPKANQAGESA
jgi:hypothetical protein